MTGEITLTGIVLLAAPANEYDKRLVLLTKERGKITVFAKGAKRAKSQFLAGTRPFAFGEFTLYEGKSAYNLVSLKITNYFEEVTNDMRAVYYGFYFLEFAEYFGMENYGAKNELLLLYQALRALESESLDNRLVRRIFELKMLTFHGEYPNVFECMKCHGKEHLAAYSQSLSGLVCEKCAGMDEISLETSTIYTMQYIITTPVGKLFNFRVTDPVLRELEMVMNRFLAEHVEKQFHSLELLKNFL